MKSLQSILVRIVIATVLDLMSAIGLADGQSLIMASNQRFIYRGNDSVTRKKELQLWQYLTALTTFLGYPDPSYGKSHSLLTASEIGVSTVVDRGIWWALKDRLELRLFTEKSPTFA